MFTRMIEVIVQHERSDRMPSADPRAVDEDDDLEPDAETSERIDAQAETEDED